MNRNRLASLILGALLTGCATTPIPDVATHVDRFTGLRTDLIPENLLEVDGPTTELVWLNASRIFTDPVHFEYYLEVRYEALAETGHLNIRPGPSLIIFADQQELRFSGSGSLNAREERRGVLVENALYQARAEDLRAIAYAKEVKVLILGQNGSIQRTFRPENTNRFVKFVMHYVDTPM